MATTNTIPTSVTTTAASIDIEKNNSSSSSDGGVEVTSQWAQTLRAAVMGANDGLVSTASLIVGFGAVKTEPHTVILAGLVCLIGGAFSMAAGEFVSVYSQYDIELTQLKRSCQNSDNKTNDEYYKRKRSELPSPLKTALASALSFAVGAAVPLLATAGLFQKAYGLRLGVVIGAVSFALVALGWFGAMLGRSSPLKPAVRVLIGGWVAMGITYGLTKLIGFSAGAI